MRFKSVHNADISQILNVIPSVNSCSARSNIKHNIKRNSDSRKSIRSMSSNDNHNDSDNNSISGIEQDSDKDEIIIQKYEHNNNTNNNPKSEQEYKRLQEHCNRLTQVLAQQQQHINQQNYINESHLMDAVQQIESMQQQQQYNHNHNHIKQENIAQDMNGIYEEKSHSQYYDIQDIINQPVFLPQPTRYSVSTRVSNPTPEPINILPPPLKTDAGKQRKQSYHEVLLMKQYGKDIKPESVHSLHTNHSTLTTASHTTVVTGNNRQQTPNTIASTPSGSDVSMPQQQHNYYGTHGPSHNIHNINNYNNNIKEDDDMINMEYLDEMSMGNQSMDMSSINSSMDMSGSMNQYNFNETIDTEFIDNAPKLIYRELLHLKHTYITPLYYNHEYFIVSTKTFNNKNDSTPGIFLYEIKINQWKQIAKYPQMFNFQSHQHILGIYFILHL